MPNLGSLSHCLICGREMHRLLHVKVRPFAYLLKILWGLDGAHTRTHNCGNMFRNGKSNDGGGVRGKENRKHENRDGEERLINPPFGGVLKTFDWTVQPPTPPSLSTSLLGGLMFHSFLSIAPLHQLPNKNILQREGDGGVLGQERGEKFSEGVWETTFL